MSPKGEVDRTSPTQAGRDWKILTLGLSVKKYPLCYCTHRAIDGALDLLREQKVGADNVKAITVSTSRRNATILRNSRPQTGLEAKFSMQFAMASSIVANRVGLRELTDEFVLRKDVQALIPKVDGGAGRPRRPQADGQRALRPGGDRDRRTAALESARVTDERGSPQLPLSREELWAKFKDCFAVGNPKLDAQAAFDGLMSLERHRRACAALTGLRKAAWLDRPSPTLLPYT